MGAGREEEEEGTKIERIRTDKSPRAKGGEGGKGQNGRALRVPYLGPHGGPAKVDETLCGSQCRHARAKRLVFVHKKMIESLNLC